MQFRIATVSLAAAAMACSTAPAADSPRAAEDEVRIDTRSTLARAQYDANVDFVSSYRPTCTREKRAGVKRVLVTGFGRFLSIGDNATGRIVSALSGLDYPATEAPAEGEIDPPAPQLAVGIQQVAWPLSGTVEICAMILPVVWDVAPILLLRELEAFQPDLVLMNGVAGNRQDLWIELGGVNDATPLEDGSGILTPYDQRDENGHVPILDDAPHTHPNLMSWTWVQEAARAARETETGLDAEFGSVLTGVSLAGFPRSSNTYLCNNITFVTSYMMDTTNVTEQLLVASEPIEGRANAVQVALSRDYSHVPRAFLHWPSELTFGQRAQNGARVLAALADAQLAAEDSEHAPAPGSNDLAAPDLGGGDTF
jgi:pyrrolidone-carboxylate peptidase